MMDFRLAYCAPFFLAAIVIFLVSVFVFRRRRARGALYLYFLCLAAAVWSATEGLLYLGLDVPTNIAITQIQYLGIAPLPPLALFFVISFFGYDSWITRTRFQALLLFIAAAIVFMVWTNPWHHLIFTNLFVIDTGPFPMLGLKHGLVWWIMVGYHYVLLMGLSMILLFQVVTSAGFYRSQSVLLLMAVAFVWIANGIYVSGNSPIPNMDITPIAFTMVAGTMAWGFFRYRLLDVLPLARAQIFRGLDNAMMVLDERNHLLDMNLAAESLFGVRIHAVIGRDVRQALADYPKLYDVAFDKKRAGVCGFIEIDKRIYEIHVSTIRDQAGTVLARVMSLRDMTEQKQAERELRESEERFRMLLNDIAMVSVQGYAADGTILYWNEGSRRLYGYTPEEAVGKNLLDLIIPAEMRDGVAAVIRRMAATGIAEPSSELELMHQDGSRVPVYSTHCILHRPGHPIELYCVDIDLGEIRRAEQERKKLQAQLNQAHKMESVGRLAGGVAHDFNNMLGVILAHTELALKHGYTPGQVRVAMIEIRKAAERSADLTRQLLAFARQQTVAPKVLDLNQTVEGMLPMLRRLIGEDVDLSWRPGTDLWPIRMDPSQIDQILANLCVNARDALDRPGRIVIETGNAVMDEGYCGRHAGAVPGEYVSLGVTDDGSGMDRQTMEKIYDPFFTTKALGKGTGLGLATVYGIVKQNSGFIDVQSELGIGTTFQVFLPRLAAEEKTSGKPETAQPAEVGHETILLVEDEPMILDVTTTMLERLGYTVLGAGTPGRAIEMAREHEGEIHLLMTDVIMPEMNGRDLAKNMLSIYPGLRRLFMSGYTADVIAHHGVLDEGVNFIQKPFSMEDLAAKLREALA